jgi:hypothetical protein
MDRDLGNMLCTDARLFKIQKKTLGALHPHTLRTVLSLALSVESRHGAQWAIQKLERSLGVQHVLCTEARELILRSRSDGSLLRIFAFSCIEPNLLRLPDGFVTYKGPTMPDPAPQR